MLVHGTAVRFEGKGLLIKGPSGSGKSDLALRLIDKGAVLVRDDQQLIRQTDKGLEMATPERLQGLLEVRGVGIVQVPYEVTCQMEMIVTLKERKDIDRLPNTQFDKYFGIQIPKICLHAFDQSAPLKISLMLTEKYPIVDIDGE